MADEEKKATLKPDDKTEIGASGLVYFGGYIDDEFHPDLKGDKARKAYREIRDNSAVVGAIMFAFEMLMRRVKWGVDAASMEQDAQEAARFVETCTRDMPHSWANHIAQAITSLSQGYSLFEIVYKIRTEDNSDYPDGRIGWAKLAFRDQETILSWTIDDTGHATEAIQTAPPHYRETKIPLSKCLHYRTTTVKDNPEGRSILRNAWISYYRQKRIEELEGIVIERDGSGFPVARMPASAMSATTGPEKAAFDEMKMVVKRIKANTQAGLVLPSDRDDKGNLLTDLTLLTSGGRRTIDTDAVIKRYKLDIAMSVLMDFLFLGHEKAGSWALADTKTGLAATAIGAFLQGIADETNKQAIEPLCRVNGIPRECWPKLVPGDIEDRDLEALGGYIERMVNCGVLVPDEKLMAYVRQAGLLPEAEQGGEAE